MDPVAVTQFVLHYFTLRYGSFFNRRHTLTDPTIELACLTKPLEENNLGRVVLALQRLYEWTR